VLSLETVFQLQCFLTTKQLFFFALIDFFSWKVKKKCWIKWCSREKNSLEKKTQVKFKAFFLLLLCPYFSVILYDRYRYILEAQTSLIQKRGEDTLTYLNKGVLSSHIYIYFFNKQFVKKPRDSLGINFSKLKSGGHVPLTLLSLFFFLQDSFISSVSKRNKSPNCLV